jgi:WD40 repeat protein
MILREWLAMWRNRRSDLNDDTDSDDDNIDAEEIADVGEEFGKPNNPFFTGNDDSVVSDTDDDSEMEDKKKAKPDEEEEDDLIKSLKAAREKKVRNSPPDIKTSGLITDLSFHPEADIFAIGNISGELSVFNYSNEENKQEKKLKLSKKTLRGLEFDEFGSSLLTISKDKTLRILDTETWTVK